ncbi:4-hydroxybutyrate dehydrogenase [Propionigenium maris DSM 9537]|uniref:4-hydroxybutyrate dehydrogenase n=1 Tax=Propionigenium maris DSM 9537 TaxID=1123000 RepID=A0A9W6GNC6_9FUSO|nr:4-hydroxybutyrate dehydrogenase [Propionigenium maris]GLI57090.1 4-hydroxybutyrate dehydrogenase [Propionigenium maris DSM 9537]
MRLLKIQPEIHKFDRFDEFAAEYKIGEGDLIFTHQFLHDSFMEKLNLEAEYLFIECFGTGEPSDEMINYIMASMRGKDIRRVISVGGGSVIDISKLLVLEDTDDCLNYFEKKVPIKKNKELIIVPTTCGTGSEVTNIAISEIKSKKTKMGLAVDELYPESAVLIPELFMGLPFNFFVTSSIDALIHAVEAYVSPKSNPYTEIFSVKAIEMILKGYMDILERGEEYRKEIIEEFIIGSNYAGIAFGNAGVGAVHALSYPLGGVYHVPHGEANYQFFTEVFKTYLRKSPEGKIKGINRVLASIMGVDEGCDVYEELSKVLDRLLSRKPLQEYGMKEKEIESFADSVIEGQQRLLANNYVPLTREDIVNIYKNLY